MIETYIVKRISNFSGGVAEFWYNEKGQLSRPDSDGPAIRYASGAVRYYVNGLLHNRFGPAEVHTDGTRKYYINGQLHREDGPAVINPWGITQYYYKGTYVGNTQEKFDEYIKRINTPPAPTPEPLDCNCKNNVIVNIGGVDYMLVLVQK